jgi:hypothetical protein
MYPEPDKVAIFTGPDGKRMPDRFKYEYQKTRLLYEFPVISILDFTDKELEKSDNPFAHVLLAARTSLLEGKISEQDLLERKVLIATKLLEKGFTQRKVRAVLVFLENYVLFAKPEMNRNFKERIKERDKNNIMGIDEYLKQEALAEGIEKGRENSSHLFVENLLKDGSFSTKKIASLANVTVNFVNKIKKNLKIK